MTCTHCENCEDCHRSVERLKVALSIKNELRAEVSKRLGVDHLRGEARRIATDFEQRDAALAAVAERQRKRGKI